MSGETIDDSSEQVSQAEQSQGQPQEVPQQEQEGQTGPGMGDIFNREDTKRELKAGVALFAITGLGIGLGLFLIDILDEDVLVFGVSGGIMVNAPLMLGPVLAGLVAIRSDEELVELPDNLVFGTVGISALVGTLVMGILVWLFIEIAFDGTPDLGDVFMGWLGAGIAAAIAGVALLAALRKL